MLVVEPAGADPELDAPATHGVDLRHGDRQRPGQPERARGDERSETHARRLAREPGECDPRVGRPRSRVAVAHAQVVVRAEEGVEAELIRGASNREQIVVRRALLRLREDAQAHGVQNLSGRPVALVSHRP
jgi:hypothetical protein